MNDDFLQRLRRDPPADFAERLRARLRLQESVQAPVPRSWTSRHFVLALVVAGCAYAGVFHALKREHPVREIVETRNEVSPPKRNAVAPPAAKAEPQIRNYFGVPKSNGEVPLPPVPVDTNPGVGRRRSSVVGIASESVYPLLEALAASFRNSGQYSSPDIWRSDTAGQFQTFCGGAPKSGFLIATRRITSAEVATCATQGVERIVELKLGYRTLVLVRTAMGGPEVLSPRDLFLALARRIPDPIDSQRLIDNPNRTWQQVDPGLERQYIEIFGPPFASTGYVDLLEVIMQAGCNTFPWIEALKDVEVARYRSLCHDVREDGVYVETQENAVLVSQKLGANPNALGIVSYPFFERNNDSLIGDVLGSPEPAPANPGAGDFQGSRTLYLYVNQEAAMATPQLQRFVIEAVSERTIGPNGLFSREGVVPLGDQERHAVREAAARMKRLQLQ